MRLGGEGIGVKHLGLLLLLDGVALGIGIVHQSVVKSTLVIGEAKLRAAGLNDLSQLLFEVTSKGDTADLGLHHKAADIGHRLARLIDAAVFIHSKLSAVGREALLPVGIRLQGRTLEVKAQVKGGVLRIDQILAGQGNGGVSLRDDVEVLPFLGHTIGSILIGKGSLVLGSSQHKLSLESSAEILPLRSHKAEVGVFRHSGVLLGLVLIPIEHLVLSIGAYHTANEGKDKHDSQDNQACHSQAVAKKALCYQGAGRENFDTAVIVQGEVLLGAALLLMVQFLLVRHESASFLKRCARGDQPQRTRCRKSGCPPASARPRTADRTWRMECLRPSWQYRTSSRCHGWNTGSR